jgi:dihydroorotase
MARSRARVRVFSDDGHCVADARVMRRALEYVKAFGGVISQHAQDPRLAGPDACAHESELSGRLGLAGWPGIAEESIVARDVMLARHTGSRVHIAHVSTAGSVEVIRWAKAQGVEITAEVTPHHLLLTEEAVRGFDSNTKMNPPLRTKRDVEVLLEALIDGTIDCIATDHAPHAASEKEGEYDQAAFGIVGLETAVGLLLDRLVKTGALPLGTLIARLSRDPARLLGLPGGSLAAGAPADVTILDLEAGWTIDPARFQSKSRNSPFGGWALTGRPWKTIVGGRFVWQ